VVPFALTFVLFAIFSAPDNMTVIERKFGIARAKPSEFVVTIRYAVCFCINSATS
jgi:hypothetical protein